MKERGLLQPVLVRPVPGGTYELIAGERRWRAAQLAGLEAIPAIVRPHDDAESLELALIENMAREDLNPVEEARAVAALVEDLGLSKEEVGPPARPLAGRHLEPAAAARPARRGARADRVGSAVAGPRPGAAHRARTTTCAAGSPARRPRRAGRSARPRHAAGRPCRSRARSPSRRQSAELHPDQADAAERLGEAFGRALGVDVKITPRAEGYRVQFAFETLDEALEAAERLGVERPA